MIAAIRHSTGSVRSYRRRIVSKLQFAPVVAKVDAAHVEPGSRAPEVVGVGHDGELRLRVDEPDDQPGARGAVDMYPGTGAPPHRRLPPDTAASLVVASSASPRRACLACSRREIGRAS